MKDLRVLALFVLAVVPAAAVHVSLNPITRVVQLLEGLSQKLANEAKEEEGMYDKYMCWYQTVISSKTQSNAAAKDRISFLEAFIKDVEAGRVEFTSERSDLTKAIGELHTGIEEATNMRDKEHEDYLAAKEEMETAIAALEEAVKVLDEVNKEGLLGVKFDLRRVLKVGENILDKSDLDFMKHYLDGDMQQPKGGADWKKLNRKATFKMKYSPRSKKIAGLLKDMLQTFKDNVKDAEDKEKESKEAYDTLMESKKKELESMQETLTDGGKEGSARALKKDEAQQEVDDLNAQIEADEGFIQDAKDGHEEKMQAFKDRKTLAAEEMAAISEAISILRSDDARDTFKRSMGFFQVKAQRSKVINSLLTERARDAASVVREAGALARDPRLSMLSLTVLLHQGGRFDKVLKAIDEMIEKLEGEEKDDETNKEDCEKERAEKTKEVRSVSLEIDDASDEIEKREQSITEQKEQIKTSKEEIATVEKDLKEATRQKEDRTALYEQNKKDDEAASELVGKAIDVLSKQYSFAQSSPVNLLRRQAPEIKAGEAPPPPPELPSGDYEGGKKEGKGIVSILESIKEDLEKDLEDAKKMEEDDVKEFEKQKEDMEKSIEDAKTSIADAEGIIAEDEDEISSQKEIKASKVESLEATMKELKSMQPGCDYITTNFELRKKARAMEIDGLKKAKEILSK